MSTQDNRASAAGNRRSRRSEEHQVMEHSRSGRSRRTLRFLGMWVASALLVSTQLALPVAAAPAATTAAPQAAPTAPTNTITLAVRAARTEPLAGVTIGDAVTTYKWMVNEDNTGSTTTRNANPGSDCSAWLDAAQTSPNPAYPGSCTWTSIAGLASSAPVVAQGDETTLNGTAGLTLPAGRYLISVLADGYKLDGTPFTLPLEGGVVEVPLQPLPLPTATIKAQVFADVTEANGQFDPGEDGLPGFTGKITDYIGQVNTDVYGNPLCTKYQFNDANNNGVQEANEATVLDANNEPTVTRLGGKCLTGDINMDGLVNATDESLYVSLGLDPTLARGVLTIPNLGPNRYALSIVPPTGSSWVQTTTLEGNHDWDAWVMEGSTGLDTEFVVAGEPFPATIFGYVPGPTTSYWNAPEHRFAAGGTGSITGVVDAMKVYVPTTGGACLPGTIWGGLCGGKIDKPIDQPWIALSDLGRGDTAVWFGRGGADGRFTIPSVPDGTYTLTYWDDAQNYILDLQQVTVSNGEAVDLGVLPLTGWFTAFDGYVFNDANRNGKRDAGEPGVPNFGLTLRKRENSLMDRGATAVSTNQSGYYQMENAYPLTEWLVLEAYDDRYYTTGITYQADNQATPTTVLGQGVDVSVLPIIGLSGTLDWGVHAYDADGSGGIDPQNGGIVGSISYDTTRNELDPQYAAAEDWQPGVSGITVELYATVPCATNPGTPCDARGDYELASDGSYARGKLLNSYVSETWGRPQDCIARDVNGDELLNPGDQQVLPVGEGKDCLEGPLMGVQFGPYPTDQGTPDANFGAAVDGNYGFGDGCFDGTLDATDPAAPACKDGAGADVPFSALGADDYLVHIDLASGPNANDFKVTREEDINIGNGDSFVPQVPPPACAGPLHQVDVADLGSDGYGATAIADPSGTTVTGTATAGTATTLEDTAQAWTTDEWAGDRVTITAGTGAGQVREIISNDATTLTVAAWDTLPDATSQYELVALLHVGASTPTANATFVDIGGTPYEGQARPLCDTKLVPLQNGKSVVPMFNVFTDVPLPGRFFAYNVDDLNFSTDPKSLLYGEKAGLPFTPVGIYDFANRLVTTVETDYNGLFDVLLPSTNRINCPTPSGVCGNLYRFVGNDPGIPGRLNTNYNPQYRTIAAEFEAWPGIIVPADTAPTQMGVSIQLPGSQQNQALACPVNPVGTTPTTPELFTVSTPYGRASSSFTITGRGFGAGGSVTLSDGTNAPIALATSGWSDTSITATVPAATAGGAYQMTIRRTDNGKTTIDGLTFHVTTAPAVAAFPAAGILDTFNRANNGTSFGAGWADDAPNSVFNVNTNQARVRTGTTSVYDAWRNAANAVYGTNEEAYFTFTQVSSATTADEQGLLLKYSGGADPKAAAAQWIEVAKDNSPANTIRIATKSAGSATITTQATISSVAFAAGDRLGARALNDGTIAVYKNSSLVGTASLPFTANWFGQIGVRFEGTGTTAASEARFDNFGGGTLATTGGYSPNIYEVGPGKTFDPGVIVVDVPNHAIQDALDAAAGSPGDDLVVVYPGTPQGARVNPRGAYYENLIVYAPLKLQGVGPGGTYPNGTPVTGSIIDGSAYGGDTLLADAWRTLLASLAYDGNQDIAEGATVTMLGSDGEYGTAWKAGIDGFDIRGGNFAGFPTNLNAIGGGQTGLPANVTDQGGGLYVNAYVRNLQVTNNVLQGNAGAYAGGIRVGTPNLAAPDTNQHNENLRIANNRLVANAGTNLAGGIGIFAGTDGYEIAGNDICANFSAEYGGGVSVYGLSPNGKIHHNRLYFNRSYDEGGGIMVAGELPADPGTLSPGSGPVDIYANLVQANLGNDDGGGIRFLMAGNFPINVYDNMIVNNVSTHEGGGIAIDDAPAVRVYSNTIMKNITTSTAVTSNGLPAPAGLSTGANSALLQATLPGGVAGCGLPANAPCFSDPLLFNNIFWDNRSGTRALGTVTGIGAAGDATPINRWDMGVADGTGSLAPTNSVLQVTTGTTSSPTNIVGVDPAVVGTYDVAVSFSPWRTNPNFVDAILVAVDVPPALLGDYHITAASTAVDRGAASKNGVAAPVVDIDGDYRTSGAAQDAGADELPGGLPPAPTLPALPLLDNFNRANANTLGGNWSQATLFGSASIRVNANQAFALLLGSAMWNGTGSTLGARQGAAFTFATAPVSGLVPNALILKASGGTLANPQSFIRVGYSGASVVVATTINGNTLTPTYTTRATFAATFASGDTLSAVALDSGVVDVFKTTGVTTTLVGTVTIPGAGFWTATGRIGVQLPTNARIDNFSGGTLP